jgi:tRNA nucleotidyltransferase (CCA-adding enzyme)
LETEEKNGFTKRMQLEEKRIDKHWLELSLKMGTFSEDIVAPAIKRVAKETFGCEDIEDFVVWRYKAKVNDKYSKREFELLTVCQDKVILNETKSTPRSSYIEDFIEFLNNKEFFDYFPEYKEKEIIPVFSSLYLPADVVARLSKNGIYAMGMSDSVMEILNYDQCCSQRTSLKAKE